MARALALSGPVPPREVIYAMQRIPGAVAELLGEAA